MHVRTDNDNTIAINCAHPTRPFTANGSEPYYIKALVDFRESWTGCDGVYTNISYCFPTSSDILNSLFKFQPNFVGEISSLSNTDSQQDVRIALQFWSSIANVDFYETRENDCQVPIYQFTQNTTDNIYVEGHGNVTHVGGYSLGVFNDTKSGLMRSHGIGLNINSFNDWYSRYKATSEGRLRVVIHETGHGMISLKHPFSGNFSFTKTEDKYTTASIMNYNNKKYYSYTLRPRMPMPWDMEAAQFVYGTRIKPIQDDVYYLKQLVPSQSIYSWLLQYRPVCTFPWDNGGTNTISAQDIYVKKFILDINPYGQSLVGNTLMMMPNIPIHNVIGSPYDNYLILNALDNLVDISAASQQSHIIVDPKHCGHDTIIGFNINTDKLILYVNQTSVMPTWKLTEINSLRVAFADVNQTFSLGTKIEFDQFNSITLADIESNKVTDHIFQTKTADDIETMLWDLWENFPVQLVNDFLLSFFCGSIITFVLCLNEKVMKKYGCNENQIRAFNRIIQFALILTSGMVAPSVLGMVVSITLGYLNCKPSTCQNAGTVSALSLAAGMLVSTPEQLCNFTASVLGGYFGCKLTAFLTHRIIHFASIDPADKYEPSEIGCYARGKQFTLWASKKISSLCHRGDTSEQLQEILIKDKVNEVGGYAFS